MARAVFLKDVLPQKVHIARERLFLLLPILGQSLGAMHSPQENLPRPQTAESKLCLPLIGTGYRQVYLQNENAVHTAKDRLQILSPHETVLRWNFMGPNPSSRLGIHSTQSLTQCRPVRIPGTLSA